MEPTRHPQLSNTDHYAAYIYEREGKSIITSEHGFLVYKIMGDSCHIHECYVEKDKRRYGVAWEMADKVVEIARINDCKTITACVVPSLGGASESMAAQLAYGFKIVLAQQDCIFLSKEI